MAYHINKQLYSSIVKIKCWLSHTFLRWLNWSCRRSPMKKGTPTKSNINSLEGETQNAANRHGRSSQTCLVVPLHVVRVTRVARPHMSSMVTRVTRVTRLRTRARGRARVRAARARSTVDITRLIRTGGFRRFARRVQHARGRARGTRVTHAHRKHGR